MVSTTNLCQTFKRKVLCGAATFFSLLLCVFCLHSIYIPSHSFRFSSDACFFAQLPHRPKSWVRLPIASNNTFKDQKKLRHGIVNASYNFCFNKKPWYITLGDGKSQKIEAELHTTNKLETMTQRKKALPMSEFIVT